MADLPQPPQLPPQLQAFMPASGAAHALNPLQAMMLIEEVMVKRWMRSPLMGGLKVSTEKDQRGMTIRVEYPGM